jgi:hypothetical protein
MTSNPVDPSAASPAPAYRLAFDAVIGAIFRIAFDRPGDHDIFRNASARAIDFIGPVVVLVVINVAYELSTDPLVQRAMGAGSNLGAKVLGLLIGGILLRAVINLAVTSGLAKGAVAPERVGPGKLAYAWMHAVLVGPWTLLGKSVVSGGSPEWLILLLGGGILLFLVVSTSRIMSIAFGVSVGFGAAFAWTGSVVSFLVDQLISW